MATVVRVKRISNPRHRVARRRTNRHRKMTAKQIRYFGSKRQRAALRAKRHRPRTNPRRAKTVSRRRRKVARTNPALVVTLGSVANPHRKRRKNVPATRTNRRRRTRTNVRHRRRTNRRRNGTFARRHRRRSVASYPRRRNRRRMNVRHRRRNSPRIVVMRPNRRRYNRRRSNPMGTELFGQPLFGKNSLELIAGGFAGLLAAKFIPTLVPASITGGIAGSSIGKVVISGISAVVGAWALSHLSIAVGQGALFGGMIQTASVLLNGFLPSLYGAVGPYATLGDLTAGAYPVPMNPILAGRPPVATLPSAAAQVVSGGGGQVRMVAGQNGLGRTYGPAY